MTDRRMKSTLGLTLTALAMVLILLSACGSDSSNPQVPTGLNLDLSSEEIILGDAIQIEASVLYDRDLPLCDWMVDGVVGGAAETGTISQDNPATYTAPVFDTGLETVEISAVWRSDTSITGESSVTLQVPILVLSADQDSLQVGETLSFSAALEADRSLQDFDWYVNGILDGDVASGTITQYYPAIYTAPQAVPTGGGVEIEARWRDNPDFTSSDLVSIHFTVKHVNASTGVNVVGGGTVTAPFKTITYALEDDGTVEGDIVLVAPGVYNHELGEDNSISTPSGITLRGVDRDQCFVDGNPAHDGAIFYMNGTTFENFTLRNPGYPDSDMKYAIQFQSFGAIARNIKINDAFQSSAIYVTNTNRDPIMENCEFVCTQAPHEEEGVRCNSNTKPTFIDCEISGWTRGISSPDSMLVQGCTITGNEIGVYISTGSKSPDLGGGPWGSLGGNTIQLNDYGIKNYSDVDVYAQFNSWTTDPPTQGPDTPCDISDESTGTVIWD